MYCNQCGAAATDGQFCVSCGNKFSEQPDNVDIPQSEAQEATGNTDQWHYLLDGKKMGPTTLQNLQDLAAEGKISRETAVLDGQGDWKVAGDVVSFPSAHYMRGEVNNIFVWLVVAVPVAGIAIELIANRQLAWVYLVLNVILCSVDAWKLENARRPSPSAWWCLLIPVYLWQRATLLKQKRIHFWAWIAAFVVSIGIQSIAEHGAMEKSACQVVTQIIEENYKGGPACKAVRITETVADGFYRGKAVLSNGKEINVAVEKQKDGGISVTITE